MNTYPLFKAHIPTDAALAGIREVFDSGFVNEGVQVSALVTDLCCVLGTPNLVLTNSCTSAITLALRLAGVGPGTSVVTTPMTCVASNTPIVNAGAELVWADIDPETGMLDPADVERKIRSWTRAVVAVAWAGTPPELGALGDVCRARGIPLILDAAHAFGAGYAGEPAHRAADFTCYSFQAIKHFTTGDGGALVCRSDADHRRASALKWFGIDRDAAKDAQGNWKGQQWAADIVEPGYKFNLNNIAAAIGLAQLPHIDGIIAAHRRNAALYDSIVGGRVRRLRRPAGAVSSSWVYTVRLDGTQIERDALLAALNAEGIMAGVVHVPNDDYTAFAASRAHLPGVREFAATQFSLPCGWWLTEGDVRHIARRVMELA